MSKAKVTVLSLGGTIAMTGDRASGVQPTLAGAQLLEGDPSLAELADIQARGFRTVPGAHLRLDDLAALAEEVAAEVAEGSGVVVTTGTDTLEEVAFALDLLVTPTRPVVVTGAMRNPAQVGADGPANIHNAVVVAASGEDLGGVVVSLGDEVHAARFAAKRHATRPAAFVSPGAGPIGLVLEDRLVVHTRPRPLGVAVPMARTDRAVRVPIVTVAVDDDGLLLDAAAAADGLVVACLGAGHVPPWLLDRLGKLAATMPVVAVSRTGEGALLRSTYGFPGSERDLWAAGVLPVGTLDAVKARLLVAFLLRAGLTRPEVATALAPLA